MRDSTWEDLDALCEAVIGDGGSVWDACRALRGELGCGLREASYAAEASLARLSKLGSARAAEMRAHLEGSRKPHCAAAD